MARTSRSSFPCPPRCSATCRSWRRCSIPLVVGTTGWLEHLDRSQALIVANDSGLVWSPNFSVGVNVFPRLVSRSRALLKNEPAYGAWAWEIHHITKKDAPSGTLLQAGRSRCKPPDTRARSTSSSSRAGRIPARTRSASIQLPTPSRCVIPLAAGKASPAEP